MPARRHALYEFSRSTRDSNAALAAVLAVAGVASIPSARVARTGFRAAESGVVSTASWTIAATLLAGYLVVQFLAAVPAADEYVADNPDSRYGWAFACFRAVAIRPFATLAVSVWLFVLAVVAPFAGVPTAPAVLAGVVACSAFAIVASQPHAGPTLDE